MTVQEFIGTAKYDEDGQLIWGVDENGSHQLVVNVRAWGAIQNLFKTPNGGVDFSEAVKFQDSLGEFIASAINEKIEHESNNQP